MILKRDVSFRNSLDGRTTNQKTKLKWIRYADRDVKKAPRPLTRRIGQPLPCDLWCSVKRHSSSTHWMFTARWSPRLWRRSDRYVPSLFMPHFTTVCSCSLGITWHAWTTQQTKLKWQRWVWKDKLFSFHFFFYFSFFFFPPPMAKLLFAEDK